MTISELYRMFDDISYYTKTNVYVADPNQLFFSGRFSDMSIELTQAHVVRFRYDYSQDTLFVII